MKTEPKSKVVQKRLITSTYGIIRCLAFGICLEWNQNQNSINEKSLLEYDDIDEIINELGMKFGANT